MILHKVIDEINKFSPKGKFQNAPSRKEWAGMIQKINEPDSACCL
jgi:hypothetical protein